VAAADWFASTLLPVLVLTLGVCLALPALQNTKFNRLALRRLMVQAMPWLDWQERNKGAEVRALAEWLWWLAEESRQQGVVGVEVDTELPARARARRGGWEEMMMLMGH
jgi:hypothetical protein